MKKLRTYLMRYWYLYLFEYDLYDRSDRAGHDYAADHQAHY